MNKLQEYALDRSGVDYHYDGKDWLFYVSVELAGFGEDGTEAHDDIWNEQCSVSEDLAPYGLSLTDVWSDNDSFGGILLVQERPVTLEEAMTAIHYMTDNAFVYVRTLDEALDMIRKVEQLSGQSLVNNLDKVK